MNESTILTKAVVAVVFLLLGVLFTYLIKPASVNNLDSSGSNVGFRKRGQAPLFLKEVPVPFFFLF